MAMTFIPNHEAQMTPTRMEVIAGMEKPGAIGFRYCDVGFDVERVGEFDSLSRAFDAMLDAGDAVHALLARVFPKAGAL